MKRKRILVVLIMIFIIVGCGSNKDKNNIGENEAINIALKQVGIKEKDTTLMKTNREDAGEDYAYTVEFHYDNNSYIYVIGSKGEVYSSERRSLDGSEKYSKDKETTIGFKEEDALNVALKHAGVPKEDAMLLRVERDSDDGQIVFEIEFRTATSEYEFEISEDGTILEYDKKDYYSGDVVYTRPTYYYSGATRYYYSGATRYIDPSKIITDQEAVRIALEHAGLTESEVRITKLKRDSDEYDVDFYHDGYKYEYDISLDGVIKSSKKKIR